MIIQLLPSRTGAPQQHEGTWAELVAFLTDVQRTATPKDKLPCWSPCELVTPGATRGALSKANVKSVSALVLDFDEIEADQRALTFERLRGVSHCWHSSFRHSPVSGQLRYRVVVELDRPVPNEHWPRFIRIMHSMLCVGTSRANGKIQPDESCKDSSRLFYGPHCPEEGPEPESGVGHGEPLPVLDILGATADSEVAISSGAVSHTQLRAIIPRNLNRIGNDNTRAGYQGLMRALDGQSFAVRGERHNTLLYMSGILAREFPEYSARDIIATIAASLRDDEDKVPADKALADMLDKDLEKERERRLELQQAPAKASGGRIYEGDELEQAARDLGLPNKEALTEQLIILAGSDYYVLWNGDYTWLGGKERAEIALVSRLAAYAGPLPITLGEDTAKGFVFKSLKKLVLDYGKSVQRVRKDLRVQHSRLDIENDQFIHAVCRRDRKLRPVYNDAIQQWLVGLGEPALIDWCATVARLEKPTAGLLLDGAPQTGKSQFAKGVAAIWGERYTPLRDLSGAFNDSISRCPLLYAEESVPWDFRRDTGLLKDLITSDSQQLRQKYADNAALAGAVRLIIAKNDHRLFEAGEVLSHGTTKALEQRLLHVYMGEKPAPHFPPQDIAQHFLWLEQNHTVAVDPVRAQLWVSGKPSRLHYRLRAFTTRAAISVCQWLMSFIENPMQCGDTNGSMYRMDSQGLQVAPKLVYAKWPTYCGAEGKQPTLNQVSEALGGIGTRNGTLYKVDLNVLAEYADSIAHQWASVESLQGAIERAGIAQERRATN